ncbi:RNA ligase partner protein [Thermosulfidibacter takaii]
MEKFVLDTSIFTNPETYSILGDTPREAFLRFIEKAGKLKDVEFYMPPSVYNELMHFVGEELPPETELLIRLKPPRKYEIQVTGAFLYELIDEIRERINKGLRVAETAVREITETGQEESTIARLREKYRQALREGIIDSKEDLEIVLLAMELDATVVSIDYGVRRWAEKLGIRLLDPRKFFTLLNSIQS